MKRNKRLALIAVFVLFSLALSGCFSTRNAIMFDDDWQAYIGMDIITDDFGPGEKELKDPVARLKLFFRKFSQVEAGKKRISYISEPFLPINDDLFGCQRKGLTGQVFNLNPRENQKAAVVYDET